MKDKRISLESAEQDEAMLQSASIQKRRRYSLAELLEGADLMVGLNTQTKWALEGGSVGREI